MDDHRSSDAEIAIDQLAELLCRFDALSDSSQRRFIAQSSDWPASQLLELAWVLGWFDEQRAKGRFQRPADW